MDNQPSERERREQWLKEIGESEQRKKRARRSRGSSLWTGLGVMGMIGWSVVLPALLGLLLGLWIDNRWPGSVPWTLVLLLIGIVLGSINAWLWVVREQHQMMKERKENRDE